MLPRNARNQVHHFEGCFGIQIAGGLVGKDNLWLVYKGAGDTHPLLLTARKRGGLVPGAVGKPDQLEHFPCLGLPLALGYPAENKRQGHVFQGGKRGQQIVCLKHEANIFLPI
jgi:hypothetical protein